MREIGKLAPFQIKFIRRDMKQELSPTSLDIVFKCVKHPLAVTRIKCQGRVSIGYHECSL